MSRGPKLSGLRLFLKRIKERLDLGDVKEAPGSLSSLLDHSRVSVVRYTSMYDT